jgi:hypothetical protein
MVRHESQVTLRMTSVIKSPTIGSPISQPSATSAALAMTPARRIRPHERASRRPRGRDCRVAVPRASPRLDKPAFRALRPSAAGVSYWRTGCRVLGKVLGELTCRLGKPLVKPNSGQQSAEIAPRRSPVRVRLAPSKPPQIGGFPVGEERLAKHPGARSTRCTHVPRDTPKHGDRKREPPSGADCWGNEGLTRNARLPTRAQQSLTRCVGQNARGPAYTVNEDAVRHAKRLIDARQYVLRSRWQDVQPRATRASRPRSVRSRNQRPPRALRACHARSAAPRSGR